MTVMRARQRFRVPPKWCHRIAFSTQKTWEPIIRNGFTGWPIEIIFANPSDLKLDDFDLVVPLNVDDALWLSEHPEYQKKNAIPVPSAQLINLCDDKKSFDDALAAAGFGIHVPFPKKTKVYPYVLKKRRSHSSLNTYIIGDPSDEMNVGTLVDDPEYFTQRLVTGSKEYVSHIIIMDGEVVCELTVEITFKTERAVKFRDPELFTRYVRCPDLPVLGAILRSLRYEGLCCFNYKMDNGVLVVLELNPRFGGSLCPLFFSFVGAIKKE